MFCRSISLFVGWGVASVAQAQVVQPPNVPEFDAQNVRPTIDARRTLLTDDAGLAPSNTFVYKMVFGTASDLLTYTVNSTGQEKSVIKGLMTSDFIVGYTISRFRVGLDVPVVLRATSDIADNQGGLGDLAFDLRGTILHPEESPVGIALSGRFGAPTATVDLPIGGSGIGYETGLIVDKRIGGLTALANIGYRGRPPTELDNITVDDQTFTRVGLGYQVTEKVGLSGDVVGYLQPSAMDNVAAGAWEGLMGFWYRPNEAWVVRAGGGAGLSQGIGTSKSRTMLSVGYEPEPVVDSDNDGLVDRTDRCPDKAEDFDGHEDADGCPDELNPVRILFRDPYGYPVDGALVEMINEDDDTQAEGSAKFEQLLTPGVWSVSVDAPDFEPFEEEFTLEEGMDLDLVFVLEPLAPPPPVRVTRAAIRITDKIHFEVNSATIKNESHSLLQAIADTMASHQEILRVRVEGHTDSRASDSYNMTLSQQRADAVRNFLVNMGGVDGGRLKAVGMGERQPLDARENPDAWDLNRRVEFMIEEREQ